MLGRNLCLSLLGKHLLSNRVSVIRSRFLPILVQSNLVSSSSLDRFQATMSDKKVTNFEPLFESTYQQVIDHLFTDQKHCGQLVEVKCWLQKAIEYNLKNGKRNRAKSLLLAYELLASDHVAEDKLRQACILGWCVELLQSYFLILDDIMDNSITRRGQLCWYRKENVGFTAINDAVMLNNLIFSLLEANFSSSSHYIEFVNLFNEAARFTTYGQCLDLISNPLNVKPDLAKYTDDRYNSIVQYKTAYYSFCLPIRLAIYLANITDAKVHQDAEKILLRIGHLFQVQDDYLDCFGDPNVTGKIGTDIEDGKCSWLVVKAIKLATTEKQKSILFENYGLRSTENVAKIKSLYEEIGIQQCFLQFEKDQYEEICSLIESLEVLPKKIFYNFLDMIYRRKK